MNQVQEAGREAQEGRWRAEVRAQLREANRRLRDTPVGVAGSLKKGLLANLEVLPDISPQTRQELTSRSELLSKWQVEEASFLEQVRASCKIELPEQERSCRYAEAQNVSVDFAEDAGITITKNSVEGQHFVEEPLMLEMLTTRSSRKSVR